MEIIKWRINKRLLNKHLIYTIPENSKSYSSLLLLNRHYRSMEIPVRQRFSWHYLFIVKRTFLRHHKNENGNWTCHYCRKELTQLPKRGTDRQQNWEKIITIDHKVPACDCENKTDSKNFLPACHQCNKDKGSMPYEKFTSERFTKPKFRLAREHDLKTIFKNN